MNGSNPGTTWVSLLLLIAFWSAALGWGRALGRFIPVPLLRLHTMSMVIGLALLSVIGGWLNVARLASAPVLMGLMAVGVVFLVVDVVQSFRRSGLLRSPSRESGSDGKPGATSPFPGWKTFAGNQSVATFAPLLVAAGLGIFNISLLVPTYVFNVQDDFQTYIPRALRIAQTGTLGGSPFDTVGLDSLGAQSFFHALFLPHIDVRMLHMFDAVGCFIVALLLVGEVAIAWRVPTPAGVLGVFAVAAINPQSVNISPLYSGVVAAVALVVCGAAAASRVVSLRPRAGYRYEVIVGLLAALLVALKLTLGFFAAMYLGLLYAGLLLTKHRRSAALKSAAVTGLTTVLGIAPWLTLHLFTIVRARNLARPFTPEAVLTTKDASLASHDIPKLWSLRSLFWGDSIATYNFLVLSCLIAAVVAALVLCRRRTPPRAYGLLSVIASAVAVLGSYLWNAHMFEVDDAIRYTLPPLIATAPLGWLCLLKFSRGKKPKRARLPAIAVCCLLLVTIATFGKTMGKRVLVAAGSRTTLSYALSERYVDYCQRATTPGARRAAITFQETLEPGATILMSAAAPFQFDFARNSILTASEAGLINPVIRFPAGISPEALRRYLRSYGIRYVFFQRDGEGIKTIDFLRPQLQSDNTIYRKLADYGIYYRESMSNLAAHSEILFENDRILLFDLSRER